MKQRRFHFIIYSSLIILTLVSLTTLICFLISKFYDIEFVKTLVIGFINDFIIAILSISLRLIWKFFKKIHDLKEYNYKSEYKNQEIRLSFAYLIRIRVNNKYLLIKSGHKRDLYGPVGGVYHIDHTDYVYKKLGFSRDNTPGDSEDVRGRIIGKNVHKFVRWFNKRKNRELNPSREFNEEMISSGIVPENLIPEPSFKFICTKYRGIQYGAFYNKLELCRFDVFELLLSKDQEDYFINLKDKRISLVTRHDIETGGVNEKNDKRTIGDQTPYILED